MKKKLVVLTGAGISAESGIKTFRDSDGLWEGHDVMEVATPEGWRKNQELVLDFYNKRRQQLKEVEPNLGHKILAELEKDFDVYIITQNVDDLHERAGSTKVLHLHGELLKVRSTQNRDLILDWTEDLITGDLDENGYQLRPHIVWFGEDVPALEEAIEITETADYFAVIGTSLQVYPAAGLISYTDYKIPVFYIDPKPISIPNIRNKVEVIAKVASEGVAELRERLKSI
ncbi:SIR2 family NAD-dependent protein deacylase [Flavobacterium pectinovorum]|uniref:SIR2 family NAD-dependent protein deacylase n=1 Tax=Flavobacterium pectinovorum TaxID=29533 RepID=UPI001FAD5D0A|nr:NAD-dependent deacylase [Flavobacterium pectinovorum]MCI9846302.1 NAD-dependent deacylase [Flavobacterium pectinovorum]